VDADGAFIYFNLTSSSFGSMNWLAGWLAGGQGNGISRCKLV
jgi:hypothetical protein